MKINRHSYANGQRKKKLEKHAKYKFWGNFPPRNKYTQAQEIYSSTICMCNGSNREIAVSGSTILNSLPRYIHTHKEATRAERAENNIRLNNCWIVCLAWLGLAWKMRFARKIHANFHALENVVLSLRFSLILI